MQELGTNLPFKGIDRMDKPRMANFIKGKYKMPQSARTVTNGS